jgi:predicted ATPase
MRRQVLLANRAGLTHRSPFKKIPTVKSVVGSVDPSRKVGRELKDDARIKRIVLTGGPCGGKSSSMSHLSEFLRAHGFSVYLVPEAATLMMQAGVSFANCTRDQLIDTQAELCRVQLSLEDSMYRLALQHTSPAVILSDRGAMDGKAYLESDMWNDMLKRNNWTTRTLREGRYDGVAHLITTAVGAMEHYNNANNRMRSEKPEEARKIDETLQQAWLGHPHVALFDNSTNFAGKLQRVTEWVCSMVGLPVPDDKVKRFLVKKPVDFIPVPHTDFVLTKAYLRGDESDAERTHRRIESRTSTQPGSRPVYRYKEVRFGVEGKDDEFHRIVNIRRITGVEYSTLAKLAVRDRPKIKQLVRNFVYKDSYFSLVQTIEPASLRLNYLSVTSTKQHHEIEMPDWIDIGEDVTDNHKYTSHYLSRVQKAE